MSLLVEWRRFSTSVLDPIAAGDLQRQEMRRAFYAGATSMFRLMNDAAGPADEPDVIGAARVELLFQELRSWERDLREGRT